MSSNAPLLIEDKNLSHAWARVLLHIIDNPGKEISPLVISLHGFINSIPQEDQTIREALDNSLMAKGEQTVHTVANTIFPLAYWREFDRKKLFDTYIKNLPRIKRLEPHKNRRGLYFERLIAFDSNYQNCDAQKINQLEHIIFEYNFRLGVRKSMFQASIFDPAQDHVRQAQLGFPCLQHISFVPNNKDKTLTLNAFYATQQILDKAYGNYLGLCRLGNFMAHEMGLQFERMNCFVGVEKLRGEISKSSPTIEELIQVIRKVLSSTTYV
jgi:hypothetical protein